MKAMIDGVWTDIPCRAVPNNDSADAKKQLRALFDRLYVAESACNTLSRSFAPLTATTPSLKKYFSKSNSGYATQGGCTDGTHLYFYIRASNEENAGTLVKLKLSDYSTVKTASISLYHGNDMTYNPDTGMIYVATMYRNGSTSRVDVVDPDTLTKVKSIYAPMYISAIAYDSIRHVFVGASGGTSTKYLLRLNDAGEFEWLKNISAKESPSLSDDNWTSQGIACDSAFIYYVWTRSPSVRVEIFNWLGEYMGAITKSIKYDGSNAEIEFIDKLSRNEFIIGAHVTGYSSAAPIYTFSTTS